MRRRIAGRHLVTPTGVLDEAVVEVTGTVISAVEPYGTPADEVMDGWLVPGFVDTHCHGGGGHDYATTDPDAVRAARDFHRRAGTTTSFASLVTAEVEVLGAQLELLGPLVAEGELAGIHLEGPFLSPARRGAHDAAQLTAPDDARLSRLLAAGGPAVRMVTVAPELDGGLAAISRLVRAGVTAAVGHTDGDEQVAAAALDAGATVVTHLFNAMRPIHHREPGPVPRLLTDPRVMVEIICDGFHLHPDVLRMVVAAAGTDRVALVTDAMAAAGMPDGDFTIGGLDVAVRDHQARLREADGSFGSIAGLTLTMAGAVQLLVRQGIGVPDVAVMAATTPARQHRLTDVGAIEAGRRADLCLLDDTGTLQRVMQSGEWVR